MLSTISMLVLVHRGERQGWSSEKANPSLPERRKRFYSREWSSILSISPKLNHCTVMEWRPWSNLPAVNAGKSTVRRECLCQLRLLARQRVSPRNVFYYRCPDHRKNYVMSFVFCFDREDDIYQFAYSFPYSYTKLQNYLDNIEQRQLDYVQRRPLVFSVVRRVGDLSVQSFRFPA